MPSAARVGELAGRHAEVEEEVLVGAREPHGLGDVGRRRVGRDHPRQQLAQEHERPGAVAVVALVAHLEHLGDDRPDVDRAGRADRLRQDRPEDAGHPVQPLDDLGAVRAVAQHLAQPLVERAPRLVAVDVVAQRVHPHRRADDAGHRPDGSTVVARLEVELACGEALLGILGGVGEALEEHGTDERALERTRRALPLDGRAGVEEGPPLEPEGVRRRHDVDEDGLGGGHPLERQAVGVRAARVRPSPGRGRPRSRRAAAATASR